MPRPREDDTLAVHTFSVRMTPGMVDWIDQHRGGLTRGRYLRELVRQEAARQKAADDGSTRASS
jgi:hypothetical protein